jgi:hypothetical protein
MNTLSTQLEEASMYLDSELSRSASRGFTESVGDQKIEYIFDDEEEDDELTTLELEEILGNLKKPGATLPGLGQVNKVRGDLGLEAIVYDTDYSAEEIDKILTRIENQLERHDAVHKKLETDKRVKEVVESVGGGLGQGFNTKEEQESKGLENFRSNTPEINKDLGSKYREFIKETLNKDDVMYTDPRTGVELTGDDVWKKLPDTYYPKWVGGGKADIVEPGVEKPKYSKTNVTDNTNLVKKLEKQLDEGLEAWENEKKKFQKVDIKKVIEDAKVKRREDLEKDSILALWNIKPTPKKYYLNDTTLDSSEAIDSFINSFFDSL